MPITGIPSLLASLIAMRSWSAWARINLAAAGASFDELELRHLLAAPLERAAPHYSREKYVLNASSQPTLINVHGVYEVPTGLGFPGQALTEDDLRKGITQWPAPQLLMDPSLAYHFHFVNVGRDRSRDKGLSDLTLDPRAADIIKANLDTPRGKRWLALQQTQAERNAAQGLPPALDRKATFNSRKDGGTAKFTPGERG